MYRRRSSREVSASARRKTLVRPTRKRAGAGVARDEGEPSLERDDVAGREGEAKTFCIAD